ncbi:TetR family transcriptional regulator [Microbacterium esteraromaticum]|uniref:TetR family transcriptional regulator n=1 Tax=Microbacterium esteraromaticum TaxID=57043 RepID=A0A7D7WFB7_9MICO|nr:TetR family transcriptional regulator [Microbacterium esteraromaticum]QMU95993.1 TetR family transcriptional regulator [Microbacterium esteraromaticum]
MSNTRIRALEAAVTLIGTEGIRALTHGRIDAAASLPAGSTSNHFRTRAALLAGVIQWIAEAERAEGGFPVVVDTAEDLIAMLQRALELESGPGATRTRARYALFLEALDHDAAAPLRQQRRIFEEWTRDALVRIGGPDAAAGTRMLMAACDGLLLHRVTVDPDAPTDDAIRRAVTAALGA